MPRAKSLHATCQYCKIDFYTYPRYKRSQPKFCSISCGVAARNKIWAISPQEVFFRNISRESHPNGCWIYLVGKRYGKMKIGGKYVSAHRYSFHLHHGVIPKGLLVCHSCDTTLCVNPDHLFLGTSKDNRQDMLSKNRGSFPKGSKHHRSSLTEDDVRAIKALLCKYVGVSQLAKQYNVSRCLIDQIRQHRSWNHVPWPD